MRTYYVKFINKDFMITKEVIETENIVKIVQSYFGNKHTVWIHKTNNIGDENCDNSNTRVVVCMECPLHLEIEEI